MFILNNKIHYRRSIMILYYCIVYFSVIVIFQPRCITRLKNQYNITLHYITLLAFPTPPTPKVTSGASTITCYTKYSPPAQHAG